MARPPLRPQRLQALQRHLRPPRRRRSPHPAWAGSCASVGDDGVAYRFGGDEFCVLLTCEEDRFDEVARAAASSLTESGSGRRGQRRMGYRPDPRARPRPPTTPCSSPTCACTRRRSRAGRAGTCSKRLPRTRHEARGSRRAVAAAQPSQRPHGPPDFGAARSRGPRRGRRASPPRRGRRAGHGRAGAPAAARSRRRRSPPAGWPRPGRVRARPRSRASGPSRAPRGRRAARSVGPRARCRP